MLEYHFYLNQDGTPQFDIKPPLDGLSEIGSCGNHGEIVESLEKVLKGDIHEYRFGYEVYLIESDKKDSKIINTFDDWKVEAVVPTQKVYEMMKDWKIFLEKMANK